MRFSLLIACLAFGANCLSGCASVSSEQVGSGLVVGGAGSGSSGLVIVGAAVDIIGSAWNNREGSPEYQKRRVNAYNNAVRAAFSLDFGEDFRNNPEITNEQVTERAQAYCDVVAKKVAAQEVVTLSRKTMKIFAFPDEFLPEGNDDTVLYKLTSDPFTGTCLWALEARGMGNVREARDKAAKAAEK